MKTKLSLTTLLSLVFCLLSYSQIPQGFNYQAIARDGSGNPIPGPINVKIAILTSDNDIDVIWEEEHTNVPVDGHGLFSIVVGQGNDLPGGLGGFSEIDWTVTPKYIRTKINDVKLGTAQLWSVPYAMVADSLGGPLNKLKVVGSATSTMEEALFEVRNKAGKTVFAVYNEGVRIYIGDGSSKTAKGGFSVGGFGSEKDENNKQYLFVDDDSVRIWVNDLGKSAKGGFSVGGFGYTKDQIKKYFYASEDSVRIYIDDTGKAAKGGFSVGGFTSQKALVPKYLSVDPNRTNIQVNDSLTGFSVTNIQGGSTADFMKMNKVNYFLGHESGSKTVVAGDNGKYNSFLGYQSGHENISGKKNVFLGYKSGYKNNASYNVFVGNETGLSNTGEMNVFIGHQSGTKNTTGLRNSFIGYQSGAKNTEGYNNVYLGYYSGGDNLLGNNNTALGCGAGFAQTEGSNNVFIGSGAGSDNWTGSGNVFIGNKAGADAYNVSNQLLIANSNTHNLIVGTFGTSDANSQVDIKGSLYVKGVLLSSSDTRLKTGLTQINDVLDRLVTLNAYHFYWNQENEFSKGMSPDLQVGLLAQDVEKIFPELVKTDPSGYKSLDYLKMIPLVIEALKEQGITIESQRTELEEMRKEVNLLKTMISETVNQ